MAAKGRPTTITPEIIAGIKASQANGLTREEAANLYNISLSSVAKHWPKMGHGTRGTRAKVAARLKAGEDVSKIANAMGLSAATVRRYRRELDSQRAAKRARP